MPDTRLSSARAPVATQGFSPQWGTRLGAAAAIGFGFLTLTCSVHTDLPAAEVPLTPPTALCTEAKPNDCRSVGAVVDWMRTPELRIVQAEDPPSGTQGAKVLTLVVDTGGAPTVFRAKWRPLSSGGLFNDPRKEIAAYAVQSLFLDETEYVVPPSTGHCFPLGDIRQFVDATAKPSFARIRCVFGILSYWLPDAISLEEAEDRDILDEESLIDADLFRRNPLYRESVADLNLFTFLIRHGDAHVDQFLLTVHERAPHPYSVDHTLSFETVQNPMLLFREDWSTIRVPALPGESIRRLRALTHADLENLRVIEEYEVRGGMLFHVRPNPPMGDPDAGMRWIGTRLQIGLTREEIAGLEDRIADVVSVANRSLPPAMERATRRSTDTRPCAARRP